MLSSLTKTTFPPSLFKSPSSESRDSGELWGKVQSEEGLVTGLKVHCLTV